MRRQAFLFMQGLVLSPHNHSAPPAAARQRGRISMADLFPSNDEQFSTNLGNFITVANANLAALGLVAADVTLLTNDKTDLDAKITASKAAAEASKSATGAKRDSRTTGNTDLRDTVKKIEGKKDVPAALLLALGLKVKDSSPTPVQPTIPTNLVAYGTDIGINLLTWNRNANKPNTTFIIEAKAGAAAAWQIVGVATKAEFKHNGQIPGQKVAYRVMARRPAGDSDFSNTAVVYDDALPLAA